MKFILGCVMLAVPFVVLFVVGFFLIGFWKTVAAFVLGAALQVSIYYGIKFIHEDEK